MKKRLWHQSFASKHSYQQRFLPTQILTGTNSYQQSLVNTHSYQQRFLTKILTNAKFLPKESCHKHSYQHKFLPTHIFTNIFYYQQIFVPAHFLTIRFSYQHRFSSTETLTNKNTSNNTSKNTNKKTPTKKHQQQTPANTPTKTSKPKKYHQKSEHMFSARPGLLLLSMVSWLSPSQLLLSCPILAVSFAAKKHFHSRAHWRPRNVLSLAILLES